MNRSAANQSINKLAQGNEKNADCFYRYIRDHYVVGKMRTDFCSLHYSPVFPYTLEKLETLSYFKENLTTVAKIGALAIQFRNVLCKGPCTVRPIQFFIFFH